jgi:hypothetical protein
MQKKEAKTVAPKEVPEVIEFLDAQDAMNAFKEEHAPIFEQFRVLAERYNAALQQADKACRSQSVSCGPFDLYQFTTKYDAEALHNAVGRDKFLLLGGKISTQTVYGIDKGRIDACIAQNKILPEVVELVRKETPAYHKPDQVVLP